MTKLYYVLEEAQQWNRDDGYNQHVHYGCQYFAAIGIYKSEALAKAQMIMLRGKEPDHKTGYFLVGENLGRSFYLFDKLRWENGDDYYRHLYMIRPIEFKDGDTDEQTD